MRLLLPLIRRCKIIDEIVFWVNTEDADDIAWMTNQADCRMLYIDSSLPIDMHRLGSFWITCDCPDTIYVKIDDDVVWIEPGAIERLVEFRYDNSTPFLVFPQVLNNYRTSWLLQRAGCFQKCPEFLENPFDSNGWASGEVAELIHWEILEKIEAGKITDFRLPSPHVVTNYMRNSIGVISWFGSDQPHIVEFRERVEKEEEVAVTSEIPKKLGRPCVFMNEAIFVHFAYFPQRPHLNGTSLLSYYERLCDIVM